VAGSHQLELSVSEKAPSPERVRDVILDVLSACEQPSAWDLLEIVETEAGMEGSLGG
jgi:hypothetical protein